MSKPSRSFPRPLSELTAGALSGPLRSQGFASTEIIARWGEIVGPEIAAHSEPLKINWPRAVEGDEAPPPRFPEFYGDILIWSSDVYHHDGDDAWRAMQTMQKYNLPVADQAKFLGANARRLYNIQAPQQFIRERVTQIERPDWWPTEAEIQASLAAEASVTRR